MRKVDTEFLKKNFDVDCFIIIAGKSELIKVEYGFLFDKMIINVPKKTLCIAVSETYMCNYPNYIAIEVSKTGEIIFDGTIIGRVVMDVCYELWGITCDAAIGSNRRVLYYKTFDSQESAELCITDTLCKDFNPHAYLIEKYDMNY